MNCESNADSKDEPTTVARRRPSLHFINWQTSASVIRIDSRVRVRSSEPCDDSSSSKLPHEEEKRRRQLREAKQRSRSKQAKRADDAEEQSKASAPPPKPSGLHRFFSEVEAAMEAAAFGQ